MSGFGDRVPRPLRIGAFGYFLAVLFVVFAIYTQMAFQMDWSTEAGRIGPGFFPRIVGVLAAVATLAVLIREVYTRQAKLAADADDQTHYPLAVVLLVVGAALFAYWFLLLGAAVTGVLFLVGALWFLDPGHRVRAVVLGIALPTAMFLVLQIGLNAGLPDGILPLP